MEKAAIPLGVVRNGHPQPSLQVALSNVCYDVAVGKKSKRILNNVNLVLKSGELCAVMGPSGSGKSSLLDIIADRKKTGTWQGEVLLNGRARPAYYPHCIGYMLQDDVYIANLSVLETLQFAAATKLPSSISREERDVVVKGLLRKIGLDHVMDTPVGDVSLKGISGGQKRRLSLAVALIAMPRILFLDEPTSGLDSSIALEIVTLIRQLVEEDRICLATIHQPSPEIFSLFHRAVVMSSGNVVFSGSASVVVPYFESLGFPFQLGQNPAEYLIKVCGSSRYSPRELVELFENSTYFLRPDVAASAATTDEQGLSVPSGSTMWTQFSELSARSWKSLIRDRSSLQAEILKHLFFGILVGVTFFGDADISSPFLTNLDSSTSYPSKEFSNFTAIIFFLFILLWYGNTQHIPVLCALDQLYRRELAAKHYTPFPFWAVSMLIRLPLMCVLLMVTVVILYPMCHFANNAGHFFYFYFVMLMTSVLSFYVSQGFAAFTGNPQIAYAIVPPLFMAFASISGYPLTITQLPYWWGTWGPYVTFMRWSFEGIVVEELSVHPNTTSALSFYDFENFNQYNTLWILLLNIGFAGALTFWALTPSSSQLVKIEAIEMTAPEVGDQAEKGISNPIIEPGTQLRSSFSSSGRRQTKSGRASLLMAASGHSRLTFLSSIVSSRMTELEDAPRFTLMGLDDFRKSTGQDVHSEGISLELINLNYRVPDPKDPTKELHLLKNLRGVIEPGEMCALMGASGAGKSTLLDVLAGRKTVGVIEGEIYFNGQERSASLAKSMAYVQQDDVHLPMLTVRETLEFAAHFRMDGSSTADQRSQRVDKLLDMLGLKEVASKPVGNHLIRGIPGGQKRRLSIGVEVVSFPDLIFLDEPTTGLDSATSEEVIAAVKNMSLQNRTVICTIHQPSKTVFEAFDTLVLLAYGRIIYFGPAQGAVTYFVSCPHRFPFEAGTNPAEFVVAVAGAFIQSSAGNTVSGDELADLFASSENEEFFPQTTKKQAAKLRTTMQRTQSMEKHRLTVMSEDVVSSMSTYQLSCLQQVHVLLHRYYLKFIRSTRTLTLSFVRCVLMGTLFGTVYADAPSGNTFLAYKNRYSFCFFCIFFNIIVQMQTIPLYFEDRIMFNREKGSKLYYPMTYWFAMWVWYIQFLEVHSLVFVLLAYFIAGLQHVAEKVILFYITILLSSIVGFFVCQCMAAISPNAQTAMGIYPMLVFTNLLFTGYFQFIPHMHEWLGTWAPYVSFARWGYQAIVVNEFNGNSALGNDAQYFLGLFQFDSPSPGSCIAILLAFICGFWSLLIVLLTFISFEKR